MGIKDTDAILSVKHQDTPIDINTKTQRLINMMELKIEQMKNISNQYLMLLPNNSTTNEIFIKFSPFKISLNDIVSSKMETALVLTTAPTAASAAAPAPAPAPAPTTGTGLRKVYFKNTKIIRGRGFNNSVDDSVGIQKPKAYVPFGRHYIHVGKLGQGLLQIKRSGGNTIPDLPTQRISNELQKVMEDLISGMNPSFGSVYNLSDDEKDLFNRIVRTTSIDQRLQIPAPELTNDQQMYHRYQVLAGEIASGQDNPAVIKELKGLLIKLSNKRILPKAKVHDVLCDLLALGF